MLPEKNRLRKKRDFELTFRDGRISAGRFFILKKRKNNLFFPRFAFVSPIKNEKKAVKRNKGKRLFREAVRNILSLVKENVDVIFILKKGADEKNIEEIKKDIERVFKKIKLI